MFVYAPFGCLTSSPAVHCGRFIIRKKFWPKIVLPPIKRLTAKTPCNFIFHLSYSIRYLRISPNMKNEFLCHWPLQHTVYGDDSYVNVLATQPILSISIGQRTPHCAVLEKNERKKIIINNTKKEKKKRTCVSNVRLEKPLSTCQKSVNHFIQPR